MAKPRIDLREVDKIKAAIARDGLQTAAGRFDHQSPEWRQAQRDRRRLRRAGARQRKDLIDEKENTMTSQNKIEKQSPAQQRSAQAQRAAAQEKIAAVRRQQVQRNARLQQRDHSRNDAQGM